MDLWKPTTWPTPFIEALDSDLAYEPGYPKLVPNPCCHVMEDGQNILTVAALYLPSEMTRKEYARDLAARNTNWNTGAVIQL